MPDSQRRQTLTDGDNDNTLAGQLAVVKLWLEAVSAAQTAAVEPDEDRALLVCALGTGGDVQEEAVLAAGRHAACIDVLLIEVGGIDIRIVRTPIISGCMARAA